MSSIYESPTVEPINGGNALGWVAAWKNAVVAKDVALAVEVAVLAAVLVVTVVAVAFWQKPELPQE